MIDTQRDTVEIDLPQWNRDPGSAGPGSVATRRDLMDVLNVVQDGILFVHKPDLCILNVNAAAARLLGIPRERPRARCFDECFPGFDLKAAENAHGAESQWLRTYCLRSEGARIPVRICVRQSFGDPDVTIVVCRDERPANRLAELARKPACLDALTKLPNRAVCRARLEFALARGEAERAPFAVFFVDLDRFKHVNDTFGHGCGDTVLAIVARRLARCVRGDDLVARYGGDEFVAVIENVSSLEEVQLLARRMRACIARAIRFGSHSVSVSASIGICWDPPPGHTVESVLEAADRNLYCEKRGRGSAHVGNSFSAPANARERGAAGLATARGQSAR